LLPSFVKYRSTDRLLHLFHFFLFPSQCAATRLVAGLPKHGPAEEQPGCLWCVVGEFLVFLVCLVFLNSNQYCCPTSRLMTLCSLCSFCSFCSLCSLFLVTGGRSGGSVGGGETKVAAGWTVAVVVDGIGVSASMGQEFNS
jgi:hypothetical protein